MASSFESNGGRFTYDPVGRGLQVAPRDETRKKHREVCAALRRYLPADAVAGAAAGEGTSSAGPARGAHHSLEEVLQAGDGAVAGGRKPGAGIAPEHEGAPDRKWRRVATDGEAGRGSSPGRLYHNTMEQAVGLLEWCARFVDGGGLLCYEPQRFLWWPRGRNQGRTRIVPPEVLGAFDRVQRALDGGRTRPGLADSVAGHPGDGIAGDASTSTGWGLVVGEWVFYGTWSAEMIGACEEARRRRLPEEPGGAAGRACGGGRGVVRRRRGAQSLDLSPGACGARLRGACRADDTGRGATQRLLEAFSRDGERGW